jgi:hypothetical protein
MMKEQMRYLATTIDDGGAFLRSSLRSQTRVELLAAAGEAFAGKAASALDLQATAGGLKRSGSALSVDGQAGRPSALAGAEGSFLL